MARISWMGCFFVLAMACMGPILSAGQLPPGLGTDCTNDVVQLFPCLDFLTNSSVGNVVPTCCSALSNVSSRSPFCLCEIISPINANATAQLNINSTRALQLPGLCSLSLTPASCSVILAPAVAPEPAAFGPASSPGAFTPTPYTPLPAPGASSPSSASSPRSPAPTADCSAATSELISCADFLTDTTSSPSSTCCTNLGEVASTSPSCLCQLAAEGGSLASSINVTRVTELPSLCKVTVSLSDCSSAGAPSIPFSGPGVSPSGNDAKPAAALRLYKVVGLCLVTLANLVLQ